MTRLSRILPLALLSLVGSVVGRDPVYGSGAVGQAASSSAHDRDGSCSIEADFKVRHSTLANSAIALAIVAAPGVEIFGVQTIARPCGRSIKDLGYSHLLDDHNQVLNEVNTGLPYGAHLDFEKEKDEWRATYLQSYKQSKCNARNTLYLSQSNLIDCVNIYEDKHIYLITFVNHGQYHVASRSLISQGTFWRDREYLKSSITIRGVYYLPAPDTKGGTASVWVVDRSGVNYQVFFTVTSEI